MNEQLKTVLVLLAAVLLAALFIGLSAAQASAQEGSCTTDDDCPPGCVCIDGVCLLPTTIPPATATPQNTPTRRPTATPQATPTRRPTATPQPTATPEPTATPLPTAMPEPTATSQPTATPEPAATSQPTATPEPTATPLPTATPQATATSLPTATPEPAPTVTRANTPAPSAASGARPPDCLPLHAASPVKLCETGSGSSWWLLFFGNGRSATGPHVAFPETYAAQQTETGVVLQTENPLTNAPLLVWFNAPNRVVVVLTFYGDDKVYAFAVNEQRRVLHLYW